MVAAGSTLRYVGTWRITFSTYGSTWNPTPDNILAAVGSKLQDQAIFVRDFQINAPSITQQIIDAGFYAFQVTLNVQTSGGFDKPSDVEAIINHQVFEVTGELPSASSIPEVTPPGGRPRPTGEPEPEKPPDGGLFESLGAAFKQFFSGLGLVGSVMLIVLAAVVVLVFAFGIQAGV